MKMGTNGRANVRRLGMLILSASALVTAAASARAEVKREGSLCGDPEVTLDVDQVTRAEAINRLAAAAHWSLVLEGSPRGTVSVHMKNQRASKVLDVLLSDGAYSATCDGAFLNIKPLAGESSDDGALSAAPPSPALPGMLRRPPVPAVPPLPSLPPLAPRVSVTIDDDDDAADSADAKRSEDRFVTGGNLRIEAGESVDDVTVVGGSVDVFGTVKGDVAAMGGSVHVHEGAQVRGDAAAVGGALTIDDGARVDGDVSVLGGVLHRGPRAEIHGDVTRGRHHHHHRHGHDGPAASVADEEPEHASFLQRAAAEVGSSITRTALLFVFGAILISLATARVEALKVQIAARPMRSFATGAVALVAGAVILVALCVTIVGIPFAFFAILASFVAACAGLCAVLETTGGALLGHRTRNPYAHLAFGCALFMVLGAIPFVGDFVIAAALLIGIGSVVATRAAGLVQQKNGLVGTPYRNAPSF